MTGHPPPLFALGQLTGSTGPEPPHPHPPFRQRTDSTGLTWLNTTNLWFSTTSQWEKNCQQLVWLQSLTTQDASKPPFSLSSFIGKSRISSLEQQCPSIVCTHCYSLVSVVMHFFKNSFLCVLYTQLSDSFGIMCNEERYIINLCMIVKCIINANVFYCLCITWHGCCFLSVCAFDHLSLSLTHTHIYTQFQQQEPKELSRKNLTFLLLFSHQ